MSSLSSSGSHSSTGTNYVARANIHKRSQPHLKHVTETSRFHGSLVTVHEYDAAWAAKDPIRVYLDFSNPAEDKLAQAFIIALRHNLEEASKQRVIIVEDLCHELLRYLGRTFDLSPEVFEDYLVNSGWGPMGRYDDTEPTHWKTRRLRQEHITLRWYRSCTLTLENLGEDKLELSRDSVLSTSRREIRVRKVGQGPDEKLRKKLVRRDTTTATNIWRRHLDLRIEGDDFREGESLAWEERVLIWQRKEADVQFVILLLDPSPLAVTSESLLQETTQVLSNARIYLGTTKSAPVFDDVDVATRNLVARSMAPRDDPEFISTAPDDNEAAQIPLPASSTTLSEAQSVRSESNIETNALVSGGITYPPDPTSRSRIIQLRTKATASQRPQVSNASLNEDAILPVEPLHTITTPKHISEDEERKAPRRMLKLADDPGAVDVEKASSNESMMSPNKGRKGMKRPMSFALTLPNHTTATMSEQNRLFSEARLGPRSSLGFLLKNVASRGPTEDVSLVPSRFNKSVFNKIFQQTTSTAYDLALWMDDDTTRDKQKLAALGPVSKIFNIIGNDIEDFLLFYNDLLDGIENMSQDLDTVERRLPSWRSLINHTANELRYLEERLPALATFITMQTRQGSVSSTQADPKPVKSISDIDGNILPRLMRRIKQTQERTQHSSDALVASVSFLESRQGISESRGVNLLTQLAFFFIPLSFAASFYGMQVKELPPSTTSIWQFFALTAGLTSGSYLVYFLQSSPWKNFLYRQRDEFKRFTEQRYNLRDREDDQFGRPSIWQYLWEEKFAWIVNIGGFTVIIIPIIPIWMSSLVQSIKLIVSLSLLLVSLLALAIANLPNLEQNLAARFSSTYQEVEEEDEQEKEEEEEEEEKEQ